MSRSENQRGGGYYSPKFLTPPVTPKKGLVEPDHRHRPSFSPSVFLQNLNFQLPFRKKPKAKPSPEAPFPTPYRTLYHPRASKHNPQRRASELIELVNFGEIELDPTGTGAGHNFEPVQFRNPTWCDRCGDFIWGACQIQQCLQCQNCSFTCHVRCRDLVTLDCKGTGEMETTDLNCLPEVPAVKEHNQEDGSVQGFVRVRMNLMRPINVLAGTRPPSIYDILKEEEDNSSRKTLTSFYLPKDTVKALHITSEYSAQELIVALLRKFKVADNPHKFALYESYYTAGTQQLKLRKLHETERPLQLALRWSSQDQTKQFVLQENDSSDIRWEDFALPELQNFLKILNLEEEEYLNQVRLKYRIMHKKIQEAMDQLRPPSSNPDNPPTTTS
ncbi:ras association domain-containing protein 1-like [Ornithodoros turicata]|uniref:ras association domain-containing protein 1-like n=1 Tax=Ornithodoros turicata TaxID=34597 RepID=UPI0031394269